MKNITTKTLIIVFLLSACFASAGKVLAEENQLKDVIKLVMPATVLVVTYDAKGKPLAQGSGFFVSEMGEVITNYHVYKDAESIAIKCPDNSVYKITLVIAEDMTSDLVKLQADTGGKKVPWLQLNKAKIEVGEKIVVIGSPKGLEATVSEGIISAIRNVPGFGVIYQTTAPISPGSSGSPIVNMKGEVIGVVTAQIQDGQNLNFVIPAEKIITLKELKYELSVNKQKHIEKPNENNNIFDASKYDWDQILHDSVRWSEAAKGDRLIVDLEQIKLSLSKGANPRRIIPDKGKGHSVLSEYLNIICYSDDPVADEIGYLAVKMLFDHGAKLQYCDGGILFHPIATGQYNIVKLLLENGASATSWPEVKIGDLFGPGDSITPIELATQHGHKKIVDLLISYGAERISEKEAIQARFVEIARFGSIEELKSLLKKGAMINGSTNQEHTALLNALSNLYNMHSTYLKIMYLLDMGADVNQRGKGSFCMTYPLHEAIHFSSFTFNSNMDKTDAKAILQQLLKRGAYVASEDENGRTPLHEAAERNHLFAAQLLLESGSKVMSKDKSGKTPLDNAKSAEMIKLLKKYGAKEQ